jgi:hypothetical protein
LFILYKNNVREIEHTITVTHNDYRFVKLGFITFNSLKLILNTNVIVNIFKMAEFVLAILLHHWRGPFRERWTLLKIFQFLKQTNVQLELLYCIVYVLGPRTHNIFAHNIEIKNKIFHKIFFIPVWIENIYFWTIIFIET